MRSAVDRTDVVFWEAAQFAPGPGRDAYLTRTCGEDRELRARVERLLRVQPKVDGFLEQPFAGPAAIGDLPAVCIRPGTLIGPYKLLEQIGEGGMGLVFVAEQQRPVKRRVALKIIKPGMDSRQVLARFEAERQALAMMDHANIAKVHDGGTTEGGRPYFVMELVKGKPITDYADLHRLTTQKRLELFLDVCHAVQHAHHKGIIHRDLKPSNVLVSLHDVRSVVKVIDFGVAKATGARLTDHSIYTGIAQMIGTPLYMAPEQAGLSDLDVDTRSDVYSLGVLLYELLTGTTPFDGDTLNKMGYDEMRRIIREDEPPRPSMRLSTMQQAALSTIEEKRCVEPRRLSQQVRGELDWIVMKALEKDRNRRYESASAFAADVQRYLQDDAVVACPPSVVYRLRKFTRRNRRALVTAGVIAVALVAATVVSAWQAVVARDAQHQAEADRTQAEVDREHAKAAQTKSETAERRAATEAAIAREVTRFLQSDVLRQVDRAPGRDNGSAEDLTVREALDSAAARIGERFKEQPLVEAAIRMAIGEAYHSVGAVQLAVPHLERAVTLRKAHLGPDHPDTHASMGSLAQAYSRAARHLDAIALRQQILGYRTALLGPLHPATLASVVDLAGAYQFASRWDKSVPLLEQALEQQRTICGPTHSSTINTMHTLAWNYTEVDRLAESISLHEKVLETIKSTNGPEQEPPTWVMMTFAQACQRAGKLDQADRLLREALEQNQKRRDSLGRRLQHANILGWLSLNLLLQEQYDEAEPLIRQAVATYEKRQPEVFRGFFLMTLHGAVLSGQQKYAEAEPLLLKGYEGMKQAITLGVEGRQRAEAGERIVCFYEVTNQPEKALAWREKLKPKQAEPAAAPVKAVGESPAPPAGNERRP